MADIIVKKFVEVIVPQETITITSSDPGPVSYALLPIREIDVINMLTSPRTSASGSSTTFVLLDTSKPYTITGVEQWGTPDDSQFMVTVYGSVLDESNSSNNWTRVTYFGVTVPDSWIETTTLPGITTSYSYTPPPITVLWPILGWNASGRSYESFTEDGYVTFSPSISIVSAVMGISPASSNAGVSYSQIKHSLHIFRGTHKVIEGGLYRTVSTYFAPDSVFKIERRDGVVSYYVNDSLFYRSPISSSGDQVIDVALYASGDQVGGIEVFSYPGPEQLAPVQTLISSSELISHIEQAISTSELIEIRTDSLVVEECISSSVTTAIYDTPPEGGIASFSALTGLGANAPYAIGQGSLGYMEGYAYSGLSQYSIGGGNGSMHPVLGAASGLTGGNNLDTIQYIEPMAGLAADHQSSTGQGSFAPFGQEVILFAAPSARPECLIFTGTTHGSGTLLHTGRHILTAASVLDDGSLGFLQDYVIQLYGSDGLPYPDILAESVALHPDWTGDVADGNDLAVITLTAFAVGAVGREPYQGTSELTSTWSALSYGPVVNPTTAGIGSSAWGFYSNKWDDDEVEINPLLSNTYNIPAGSMLASDYDDGSTGNDEFDNLLNIPGLGVTDEGIASYGHFGAARVLDNQIAGVASYADSADNRAEGTYGTFGLDTRVSLHTDWLRDVVGSLTFEEEAVLTTPNIITVALTGFDTEIDAVAVATDPNSVELSIFSTSISSYSGGLVSLSGITTSLSASLTIDGYATAALSGPTKSLIARLYIGSNSRAGLKGFSSSVSSFSGATLSIGGFTSVITALGLTGGVNSAHLVGPSKTLTAQGTAPNYITAALSGPTMGMLYGLVNLSGFSSSLFARDLALPLNGTAFAINALTSELTEYTNYDVSHLLRLGGVYYGASSTGLNLLEGSDDNGVDIDVLVRTSMLDYQTTLHKRVPFVYLEAETAINITGIVDGVRKNTYTSRFNGRRTKLGRGPKGKLWEFELTNIAGSAFKVGSLEAYAEITKRKV